MSPERVPMARPSRGVSPIVVSMHFPSLTAAMLEPLPRWQEISLRPSEFSLPKTFGTVIEMYLCDVPWKPYFLM